MTNLNYSLDFELSDNNYIPILFGVDDRNIQIIEKINNVKIKYRGNKLKIIGSKKSIKDTYNVNVSGYTGTIKTREVAITYATTSGSSFCGKLIPE